jgi:hypothetical protein
MNVGVVPVPIGADVLATNVNVGKTWNVDGTWPTSVAVGL